MNSYPSPIHGLDLRPGPNDPPRTSGIHLSSIIRHIALKTGELAKEYGQGPGLTDMIRDLDPIAASSCGPIVKASIGFAWEHWMAKCVHNMNHQPGELIWDGVIGSPDGIEENCGTGDGSNYVIHEFKATWKSSAYPITDQWMWMCQCMGYCYMLGRELDEPVTTAILHPVYLCGDYRANRDPIYKPTVIEFEQQELEINWRLIMDNKNNVMPEVW
jgi:hypothetical protein